MNKEIQTDKTFNKVQLSFARKILRFLKKIWILNFVRRIFKASKRPFKIFGQVLRWGIKSNEDTNFTYYLTPENIDYLTDTIAVVTKSNRNQVLGYINEARNDSDLHSTILDAVKKSDFRHTADKEVRFGRRLGWYAFARILKPEVIVETGIDKGLGSVLMCAALLKNKAEGYSGKYYGTDINPEAGYMLTGKYKEVGEILYGDSIESLKTFNSSIDLFINDSDHSAEYEYNEYKMIEKLITNKTIILGDNADITNKLEIFSVETNRHFLYFQEVPINHWSKGAGIGISFS